MMLMELVITNLGRGNKNLKFEVYTIEEAQYWLNKAVKANLRSTDIVYKENKIYAGGRMVGEYKIIDD